jgi:uncharacterized membrane protein
MRLLNTNLPILAGKRQGKFFHLFLCQVLLLIISPYLEQRGVALVVYLLLGAAVFVSGVYAVSDRHAQWIAALALAIPAGAMNAYIALQGDGRIAVPALILTILFLVFTLVSLLRAILSDERVTHDTIYGALNVYLLMALGWSMAYLLLVTLQPHAFVAAAGRPIRALSWFDCQYYSFVTLTTLGYGDIVPMTPQARSLAMMEAMSGTMYVAILIARLVGLHSARKSETRREAAGFNKAVHHINFGKRPLRKDHK